jgi:3-phytase
MNTEVHTRSDSLISTSQSLAALRRKQQRFTALLFLLLTGCHSIVTHTVTPTFETDPITDTKDAADDSVILASPNGKQVAIIGTNKRRGIELYSIEGRKLAQRNNGRLNNVDAITSSIPHIFNVAVSNRTSRSIDIYTIDIQTHSIKKIRSIPLSMDEPYGLCTSRAAIYVGNKDGLVQSWTWDGKGPTSEYRLASQTEGCVVDRNESYLYVGEEERGIWQFDLSTGKRQLVFPIDNKWLTADVEGIDIYQRDNKNYLIASSQGNNTYTTFDLDTLKPLLRFQIGENNQLGIDGTEDTDGVSIHAGPIQNFPLGLLVVQDGYNMSIEGEKDNQNFKVIDWRLIQSLIDNTKQHKSDISPDRLASAATPPSPLP